MEIKQSIKVALTERTCISHNNRSVSLIEDGEAVTLQFDSFPVEKLSEIVEILQIMERNAVEIELKRLKRYSSAQLPLLPTLPPQYQNAEFS